MWDPSAVERLTGNIPHEPGVYLMRDRGGRIVYVGKAIDLRNRVLSYFREGSDPRPFVRRLEGLLDRIDTVVTTNEKEALLLENELIKKHRPPFNIVLRDDKSYMYLRVDPREAFPRLELARKRRDDGAHWFGPYHSAASIRGTHALVNRHFGLRTCKDVQFRNRSRPCLEHGMGRCLGPCALPGLAAAYGERVEAAILFLQGRHNEVVTRLEARMTAAAEAENFEEAARLRDQVKAVRTALTRQSVVLPAMRDADAVGYAREAETAAFAVLRFEAGVLSERVPFVMEGVVAPDEDVVESFLVQYYGRAPVPAMVLVSPGALTGTAALQAVLAPRRSPAAVVRAAVRGTDADAVRMAGKNARLLLDEALAGERSRSGALGRVATLLGLAAPPRRIECYDMSTLFGVEPVGSMVVFTDGKPDRRAYRTFAVRLEEGPGDTGFMREVLKRRFARLRAAELEDGEGGFSARPDLVLLDGGEAQLGVAADVLAAMGLETIPIAAIAKSRVSDRGPGPAQHSSERLFVPDVAAGVREDGPLPTRLVVPEASDPGLHVLVRLRDEAHRFAVSFHRKRRARKDHASVLDGIDGLGPKRRTALLRAFGSVAAIRAATAEELRSTGGLPGPVADAVVARLHG